MPSLSTARWQYWLYAAWFHTVARFRKTIFGPLWILAGPIVLVGALGSLYAAIGGMTMEVFVPHLAIGVIVWSLMVAFMNSGTTVVFHNRPKIVDGAVKLIDVVMVNICIALLEFIHHLAIGVVVWFIYKWTFGTDAWISLLGLLILVINGIWYSVVFGILGVRFRDISEIVSALMGALFFITPILWMPQGVGRWESYLNGYLTFNPFHHFLELIRAPLLGNEIHPLSWYVTLSITVVGCITAVIFYRKFAHKLATWF